MVNAHEEQEFIKLPEAQQKVITYIIIHILIYVLMSNYCSFKFDNFKSDFWNVRITENYVNVCFQFRDIFLYP